MKRIFLIYLMISLVFLFSGCKKVKKTLVGRLLPPKSEMEQVKSIELAEAILWPKPYQFSLPADPFRPLIRQSSLSGQLEMESKLLEAEIEVLGLLLMEDDAIALLGGPTGIALVHKGDKIGRYTVKSIFLDRVVLEDEEKSIILKLKKEEKK